MWSKVSCLRKQHSNEETYLASNQRPSDPPTVGSKALRTNHHTTTAPPHSRRRQIFQLNLCLSPLRESVTEIYRHLKNPKTFFYQQKPNKNVTMQRINSVVYFKVLSGPVKILMSVSPSKEMETTRMEPTTSGFDRPLL